MDVASCLLTPHAITEKQETNIIICKKIVVDKIHISLNKVKILTEWSMDTRMERMGMRATKEASLRVKTA